MTTSTTTQPNSLSATPIQFEGREGLYAWEAIGAVNDDLLPDKPRFNIVDYEADNVVYVDPHPNIPGDRPRVYAGTETDAVVWNWRDIDVDMEGPGRYAGYSLTVKEAGRSALEQGLQGFERYTPTHDILRLRVRSAAHGINRRRFARHTLRKLTAPHQEV